MRPVMGQQRHVILRQTVELTVDRAHDAWPIQEEASRILRKAQPLIERCCDDSSSPDRLHRIERLELDLGAVDPQRLEEELVSKFGAALRRGLAEQIGQQVSAASSPAAASQWDLFSHFVRRGSLPWWADLSRANQPRESLDALLRDSPGVLRCGLTVLAGDDRALQRLVGHFEDRQLAALVFLQAPALARFPRVLFEALRCLPECLPGQTTVPASQFRSHSWQSILATAALSPQSPASPLDFSREVLLRLARLQAVSYRALVQALAQAATMGRCGKEAVEMAAALAAGGTVRPVPPALSGRATADALRAALSALPEGSEPGAAKGTELRLSPNAHARAPSWLPSGPDLRRDGSTDRHWEIGARPEVRPERLHPAFAASDAQWQELLQQARFSDTDQIYLGNAGLVILWPFLKAFFGRLGLLRENAFLDEAARQRGVALLQCIASGEAAAPEYLLPLNKFLCGMELDAVFELEEPLTEDEIGDSENLLLAVIAQVPILSNMSIQGFRGSFMLRAGILEIRDGAWLLRVEPETFDVVLDRFPWGFAWVKLPWMENPLQVEW